MKIDLNKDERWLALGGFGFIGLSALLAFIAYSIGESSPELKRVGDLPFWIYGLAFLFLLFGLTNFHWVKITRSMRLAKLR